MDAGEKEARGSCFARGLVRSEWEKGLGASPRDPTENYTLAAAVLSVTYAAGGSDKGKTIVVSVAGQFWSRLPVSAVESGTALR